MVQDKFKTGMYIIDKDFQILNVNAAMRELYPSVQVGDTCYRAIAMQQCQCSVCPLLQDDALFYNPLRKEWISANAATIDYPGHGECYNVQSTSARMSPPPVRRAFRKTIWMSTS